MRLRCVISLGGLGGVGGWVISSGRIVSVYVQLKGGRSWMMAIVIASAMLIRMNRHQVMLTSQVA
jgi:hypothetical protein